jgi:hypothetical protein
MVEAPEDVFNDPDGNWTYHVSILVGAALTAARAQGRAEGARQMRETEKPRS